MYGPSATITVFATGEGVGVTVGVGVGLTAVFNMSYAALTSSIPPVATDDVKLELALAELRIAVLISALVFVGKAVANKANAPAT